MMRYAYIPSHTYGFLVSVQVKFQHDFKQVFIIMNNLYKYNFPISKTLILKNSCPGIYCQVIVFHMIDIN